MGGLGKLSKRFWAVVAVQHDGEVHLALLQHDTDPALQSEIVYYQHHFGGMEILSDYTKVSLG